MYKDIVADGDDGKIEDIGEPSGVRHGKPPNAISVECPSFSIHDVKIEHFAGFLTITTGTVCMCLEKRCQ